MLWKNDPQAAQSALIKLSDGYNMWVVQAVLLEWDTMIALVHNYFKIINALIKQDIEISKKLASL